MIPKPWGSSRIAGPSPSTLCGIIGTILLGAKDKLATANGEIPGLLHTLIVEFGKIISGSLTRVVSIAGQFTELQALILAGGFATRLRPLSCSKPKLLFPIVGVPLVDHMIKWLQKARVRNLILAVNHFSDRLTVELGNKRLGSNIIFSVEKTPLGTGGPIRLARENLGEDEPFLVVNGDIVSDIDLKSLLSSHERSGAEATIALVHVSDPQPYGSVKIESEGRIVSFEEKSTGLRKPAWINAGVYVLNPSIMKRLSSNGFVSLERDIFPRVVSDLGMQGWKHHGFWYDVGNINDYVQANMKLLTIPGFTTNARQMGKEHASSGKIQKPYFIGKRCSIATSAHVEPYSILSDKVKIGRETVLSKSIVFEETSIGEGCQVRGSIIGERVTIGDRTRIGPGSIISGQIKIATESIIKPRSIVLN